MKQATKKVYLLSVGIALLLGILLSVFRSYLLLNGYSAELGHYEKGLVADLLLPLSFVLAVIISLGFGIFFRSSLSNRQLPSALPTVFASGLSALALAIWLISLVVDLVESFLPKGTQGMLLIPLILFAVLMATYFILTAIGSSAEKITILLSCSAAVFCVIYPLYAYFDTTFTLNSPIKIFDQFTLLLLAVYFLAECRFRFDRISDAAFLPIAMISVIFTAADSVPGLVYAAVAGVPLIANVMHDFLLFAFCLYVLSRMLAYPLSEDDGGNRDAFIEELSRVSDTPYEIDNETHITEGDPRQETFHFEEDEESAPDSEKETEEIETEEVITDAQTTLEFNLKNR